MLRITVVVGSLFALSTSAAYAQITSQDDTVFGVGSITHDASQDLDFLDIPLSVNRSFDDVSAQFGVGGDFEGWRHATAQEVVNLVNNWGFTPGAIVTPPSVDGEVFPGGTGGDQLSGLVALLGSTNDSVNASQAIGLVDQPLTSTPGSVRRYRITDILNAGSDDNISAVLFGTGQVSASVGHFLVRGVPAPGAVALLPVSALVLTRRRR